MTANAWIGLYGFGVLLGLIALHVPIGVSMALVGLGGLAVILGPVAAFNALGIVGLADMTSYTLSVVPLFVLMGLFASQSGLSAELFRAANAFVGHRRGGLAMASIGAAAGFGAICGSSLATAATMAKVALPEMRRHRYGDALAAGAIAAGGTLGILIPPSIMLILYAIITETPLVDLFAAALVPGVMAVAFYIGAIWIVTRRRPELAPPAPRASWAERGRGLRDAIWVMAIFALVIGGIYGGIFTPTEAAAVGAGATGALCLLRGRLGGGGLRAVLLDTAGTTAMIFLIVLGAALFSFFMSISGLPRVFASSILSLGLAPLAVLFAILLLYLVLGCFLDSLGMLILTVPVLFPLVTGLAPELGMSGDEAAVWFGVFVVIVIEIGLMTPPLGLNVFILKGAAPDLALTTIYRGVVPFWLTDIARAVLLILFPGLVLWLPGLL